MRALRGLILLTLVLLAAPAAPIRAATPVLRVAPDTIRADSTGVWRASLSVENPAEVGLYPDSLNLEWRSLDEETSVAPHQGLTSLTQLVRVMPPAGAGETTGFDWNAPADFTRGTLTFHLYLHDAKKQPFALQADVVVAGSDLDDRYPSTFVDAGGHKVEVVHLPAAAPSPAPGLLYVPPAGVSARMALRWALQFAGRGYAVSVVSLPGSGRSPGPSDRAGPASVAAVEAALARLVKEPGVNGKRLAVWGLGDGGSTALLAAVRHPELQAVVAQNAEYDPWRTYRTLSPADQQAFVRAAGSDSAAWRARAPGLVATRISTPVLVLHSVGMGAGSIASAEAFVAARAERDLPSESRIEGNTQATRRDASRVASDFLARRLKQP